MGFSVNHLKLNFERGSRKQPSIVVANKQVGLFGQCTQDVGCGIRPQTNPWVPSLVKADGTHFSEIGEQNVQPFLVCH